jgi:Carboxypeptidase regulatory-like domain/TonB dependent receptor-like, beta-barrel
VKAAIAVWLPLLAWAQTAQIGGLVVDPAGAAIGGAGVMMVHQQTGSRRATLSNQHGVYAITSLRPGVYQIQVRKSGFRTVVRQQVELDVSQHRRLDFELPLGDIRQVVTVYGDGAAAGSAEAGVGGIVSRKLVENLPINGRGLLTLLDIAPGVLTVPVRSADTGQFSVNGGRTTANYFTVDGVSANFGVSNSSGDAMAAGALPSYSALGSMHTVISLEALEHFRLVTSSGEAEYGRASGGQVLLESRGGSNHWRGAAFVTGRNEAFGANDWFLNSSAQARPSSRLWEAGGNVGGPVRKDRSFVFIAVDRLAVRDSTSAAAFVPSLAARQSLPSSVQALANLYNLPNAGGLPPGIGQFVGAIGTSSSFTALSARWDHTFRPGLELFARYQHSPSVLHTRSVAAPAVNTNHYGLDQLTAGISISYTPHAQQEARFQVGTARLAQDYRLDAGSAPDLFSLLPAVRIAGAGMALVTVGNYAPLQQGAGAPRSQRQWNFTDTLSLLRGSHLWKLGVDMRRTGDANESRSYAVAGGFDSLNAVAAGQPFSIAINRQEPYSLHFTQLSAFAQDAWKMGTRLAFSAGLRWDWYGSPVPGRGESAYALAPGERQLAPAGTPLWRATAANFAPRFGVTWRIDSTGSWVARAGAGLYYDSGAAGLFSVLRSAPFASTSSVLFAFNGGIDPSRIVVPPATAGPPFSTFAAFAPGFQPPHVWQANTTIERSLPTHGLMSASWVASAGRSLVRREWQPVRSTDFTSLDLLTNFGGSDYQALQLTFRQRAFRGLEALAGYTWSHSLDNSSRDTEVMLPGFSHLDRGNSSFDVRHAATLSFTYDPPRLRGWGIDGILRARGGLPVEMTSGLGAGSIDSAFRPDYVAPQSLWVADSLAPGGRKLNSAAFAPPSGMQGTLGRNVISGFGFAQMDAGLRREFRLGDRGSVQLRVEAFNLTNHPNFGNPVSATVLPLFGRSPGLLSTYFGAGGLLAANSFGPGAGLVRDLQIGGPRILQLQLRYNF